MTLSYNIIFENFLGYITDHNLAIASSQDVNEMMVEWLKKAYAKPLLRSLFSKSSLDDEIQTLEFEMINKTTDDEDKEFVIDILALGMTTAWLQPQVKDKKLTAQFFGGKEEKFYSQSAMLKEVSALYENTNIEQRALIGERNGIHNSYLEG